MDKQHSDRFPDSFHRVAIKGLCVRDGKLLLIRESKSMSGKWELPGGGLDFGEDIAVGFKREVKEEMGLVVTKMSKAPVYVWPHKYDNNHRNLGWYYSLVVAYRVEFEDLNITPTEECEAVGFFSKEELKDLNFAGQMKTLADRFDPADFVEPF